MRKEIEDRLRRRETRFGVEEPKAKHRCTTGCVLRLDSTAFKRGMEGVIRRRFIENLLGSSVVRAIERISFGPRDSTGPR